LSESQKDRADLIGTRFEAVKRSLDELLEIADRNHIRLGLENRYHHMDIPSPDEMEMLLSMAGEDQLGVIYDVGHAQTLERLGFYNHKQWLDRFSSRIIGVHLHDVIGLDDHQTPGEGEANFAELPAYLSKHAFRTLEVKPKITAEQNTSGMRSLQEQGCIGFSD
jgi:sugar phosphate isomerase/epimerase